ncbi:MAG: hypothetical protein M3Q05_14355, partial [Bacteroidota bacterium]|nr:hypothetical protein [Bacteroidota bacterium]
LSSCNNHPTTPTRSSVVASPYFNLGGFISGQIKQLQARQVEVEKTVTTLPNPPETKVLSKVNWAHELETFTQADINKPALRAAYETSKTITPDGQTKTVYRKLPGYRDAPIEYLEVSVSPTKQVTQIAGHYREDNYLVSSSKNFSLSCAPVNGQNQITAYQISGTQKTIFFNPLRYQVQAKVR